MVGLRIMNKKFLAGAIAVILLIFGLIYITGRAPKELYGGTWYNRIINFDAGLSIGGGTDIAKHLSGTGTVGHGGALLEYGDCFIDTVTLTGAAAGDTVVVGPPSTLENYLLGTAFVSAANTISARVCNIDDTVSKTVADATWRFDIWKH